MTLKTQFLNKNKTSLIKCCCWAQQKLNRKWLCQCYGGCMCELQLDIHVHTLSPNSDCPVTAAYVSPQTSFPVKDCGDWEVFFLNLPSDAHRLVSLLHPIPPSSFLFMSPWLRNGGGKKNDTKEDCMCSVWMCLQLLSNFWSGINCQPQRKKKSPRLSLSNFSLSITTVCTVRAQMF